MLGVGGFEGGAEGGNLGGAEGGREGGVEGAAEGGVGALDPGGFGAPGGLGGTAEGGRKTEAFVVSLPGCVSSQLKDYKNSISNLLGGELGVFTPVLNVNKNTWVLETVLLIEDGTKK